ncbi:DUF1566 domain-containing protein [Methyloterricola oryzae]|uniref:DUF1566 domain-containing protein n=1 Tax=Methyloterricola oryzae TaxID=1495050 RepID=UPI0005EBD9D7|nr:DUF1566 domain-containing protein [Methyloterricola oryzae]
MNNNKRLPSLLVLAFAASAAQAALHDRGDGMIYDDAQNITWLQSANYAKAEFAANPSRIAEIVAAANAKGGVAGRTLTPQDFKAASGQMTWYGAMAWADQLAYGGFSDWRLPHIPQPDPTCLTQDEELGISHGYRCRGSEMGHLYYVDFSNFTPGTLLNGNRVSSGGIEFKGIGVFYWSDAAYAPLADNSWFFNFQGFQGANASYATDYFAWGVRDGDVLPELSIDRARWRARSGLLTVTGRLKFSPAFSASKRRELRETRRITIVDAASGTPIALDIQVRRDNTWRAVFAADSAAVACSVKADFGGKMSGAVPVTYAPSYCAP